MQTELKKILTEAAGAVLQTFYGVGYWKKYGTPDEKRLHPSKAMTGLRLGDPVYYFNEDDEQIETYEVIYICPESGSGFHIYPMGPKAKPDLLEVSNGAYCRTMAELVQRHAKDIEAVMGWNKRRIENVETMQQVVSRFKDEYNAGLAAPDDSGGPAPMIGDAIQ